jgi:hypothetical protein
MVAEAPANEAHYRLIERVTFGKDVVVQRSAAKSYPIAVCSSRSRRRGNTWGNTTPRTSHKRSCSVSTRRRSGAAENLNSREWAGTPAWTRGASCEGWLWGQRRTSCANQYVARVSTGSEWRPSDFGKGRH